MSLAYGVPILEQVPAGHGVPLAILPLSVHTPPEQLPMPVIRLSAEAVVVRTAELKNTKNTNDNGTTKNFIPISSPALTASVRATIALRVVENLERSGKVAVRPEGCRARAYPRPIGAALALSFGGEDRDSARDDFVDLGTVESPLRMIDRCSC